MPISGSIGDFEFQKFIESPTRPGKAVPEVVVGASALPSGAATSANQTSEIALLTSIDNKIDNDSAGSIYVNTEQRKATYSAVFYLHVAGTTPTDVFVLTGSATKTVKVLRISLTATQTTESIRNIVLLKRSTLNTGGTITTPTTVAMDSANAAATAVVQGYTANATTLGTLVGNIYCRRQWVHEVSKVDAFDEFEYPRNELGQYITLRGANEMIALNFGGVTWPGNLICCTICWSEE